MIEEIAKNSMEEGRRRSRLPVFDEDWITYIKGTADFVGVNYYTSNLVKLEVDPNSSKPPFLRDQRLTTYADPSWKQAKSDWLFSFPQGIRDILRLICLFSFQISL